MAKNSNKKSKRKKARQNAEKKQSFLERQNRIDPYDATLITQRKARKDYFRYLADAIDNPLYYEYRAVTGEFDRDITDFARLLTKEKSLDKRFLKRLLEVGKRTRIIEADGGNFEYLRAFVYLAEYQWLWTRKPEEFKPSSKNRGRQFSHLLRYLLTKYDVPAFLDDAWLNESTENKVYREWFINLGMGENIRKQQGLPIPFTKKMAHNFSQAPGNLSVNGAIRWAQVISLGGDDRTVHGLLSTPLGRSFNHDDFWVSVIRLFIDNPFLDTNQYGPIYDYLHQKKFVSRGRRWVEGKLVDLGPEQPGLTMKGRNPEALLDQVQRWHQDLNRTPYGRSDFNWPSCGINGFEHKEKDDLYSVVELLSSRDLRDEGNAMHHCVASYAESCNRGDRAIYSLTRTDKEETVREVTIEVDVRSKCIQQVRRKCNEHPTDNDLRILNLWSRAEGMSLSRWLM